MNARWKRYLLFHIEILAVALAFAVYALLMKRFFPDGYFHCFMHDALRLYCPFCGGTRAFLSLLSLDVVEAFRLNSAVLIAGAVALLFDLRALILLIRKREGKLIPPVLWKLAVVFFLLYTLARNAALLYGFDRTGDLLSFWQGRITPLRAALFLPLALLMCTAFLLAIDFWQSKRLSRFKPFAAWSAAYLLVTLLCVLYARWFVLLLFLPLTVGLGVFLLLKYRKARKRHDRA